MLYNIGGGTELENKELAERIVALVGVSDDLITFVADRPGHDFRYGVDRGPAAGARLGARRSGSTTAWPTPWPGTATTGSGCTAPTSATS